MKKLLLSLIGGAIALMGVALVVPFFIPADTYKTILSEQFKKATGRDLTIAGEARLSLFPTVAVEVHDVTLSNPEGFTDAHMAQIKTLAVKAELRPLLRKQIIMRGVTLEGATFSLEERKDGSKNWEFAAKRAKADNKDAAAKAGKTDIKNLVLGNVHVRDGAITYRAAGKEAVKLSEIRLDLDNASGLDSALRLDAQATYRKRPVALKAELGSALALSRGEATDLLLHASLPGGQLSFNGKAQQKSGLIAKGPLELSIADLPAIQNWATGKAAHGKVKAVSARGQLALEGKTFALSDATLAVDGTEATGSIGGDLSGARPFVKGKLAFGTLDTQAFSSPAAASSAGEGEGKAAAQGWSDAPIDLSGLKAVDASLDIKAESVRSGKLVLGHTSASVRLKEGVLQVKDIATALYDGTLTGALSLASSGALGVDTDIKGVQIEKLMTALSGKSRLAGSTHLSLQLNGSGKSQRAIVSSLAGKGSLRVNDGAILGINIAQFLRSAKKGFLAEGGSERTDFAELTGSFTVAGGVVRNEDLSMLAPLLRLSGKGDVSLPARTVDYLLNPKLTKAVKGQGGDAAEAGLSIPLRISGPWSKPAITPDLSGVLEEGLKDPAALKKNIQNLGDTIKDYNSPKDLKKALGGVLGSKNEPAPEEGAAAPQEKRPADLIQGIGGVLKGL